MWRLQREAYEPGLAEGPETFANKRALFPEGALGCVEGEALCGYVLAIPWRGGQVVPLHQVLPALPPQPDVLVLHDLVVSTAYRHRGIGRHLVDEVLRLAAELGFRRVELVAVGGADPFWRHVGFTVIETFEYASGHASVLMARDLSR
jgi:GNAT superfamily N-acetyltransferase